MKIYRLYVTQDNCFDCGRASQNDLLITRDKSKAEKFLTQLESELKLFESDPKKQCHSFSSKFYDYNAYMYKTPSSYEIEEIEVED